MILQHNGHDVIVRARAWAALVLLLCAVTSSAQTPRKRHPQAQTRGEASSAASPWDGRYTLTFYPGESVTDAAGKSVQYAMNVTIIVASDMATYEDTHTKGVAVNYRCRVARAPDSITLYAFEDVWKTREMPTGPLCTIVREGARYYFKPGKESEFTSIEPLPVKGLRLKRTAKTSR